MRINGQNCTGFLIDTGASCNVMSIECLEKIIEPKQIQLKQSENILRGFNGEITKPIGTISLECEKGKINKLLKFEIVKRNVNTILGLKASLDFKFVKILD